MEDVQDEMPGVWLRGVAFADGSGDSGMFTGVPFVHATCSDAERLECGGSGGVFGGERGEHFYYEERKRKIAAATKIQALWRGYATRRGPQETVVCDGDYDCQELIATSTEKRFCCGDYCELARRMEEAYERCCWSGAQPPYFDEDLDGRSNLQEENEELQEENEDLRAKNKAQRKEIGRLAALILSKGRNNDLHTGENNGLRSENDELRQQLVQAQEEYQGLSQAVGFAGAWDTIHYKCDCTNCSQLGPPWLRVQAAPAPDSSSSSDSDSDDDLFGSDED